MAKTSKVKLIVTKVDSSSTTIHGLALIEKAIVAKVSQNLDLSYELRLFEAIANNL